MYPRLLAVAYVMIIGWWLSQSTGLVDRSGTPLGGDFISFYAAGHLANDGRSSDAYHAEPHGAVELAITGQTQGPYFSWHYPPTFLLGVSLLSLFPFLWAFLIWQGSTFALFAWAARNIVARRNYFWLTATFTGSFVNFLNGQTGFLSAGLLGVFASNIQRRPGLAGVAMGLSTFKPHFVLAMAITTLAARKWRAIVSSAITVLLMIAATALLFGTEVWSTFLEGMPATSQLMLRDGGPGWHKMISVFTALRQFGVGLAPAMAAHIVVAGVVSLLLASLWWRTPDETPNTIGQAATALATLIITPYALDYDLAIVGIAIAFLARAMLDAKQSAPRMELAIIVLFVLPMAARPLSQMGFPITSLVLGASFLMVWRWEKRRSHPHQLRAEQHINGTKGGSRQHDC